VSAAPESSLRADGVEPPKDRAPRSPEPDGTARARSRSGIVIGRYQATVVVTVHGDIDHPRAAHLGHVLADLIDGQGNLSLLVDLHDAGADASHVSVFADADERARLRGGSIVLSKPPAPLQEALRRQGLGHLVEPPFSYGAECAPAGEGPSRQERRAHPAAGPPPISSGGSHQ
jgi:anti-anti-sigma regulatory factor